jgi:hypothetical protein
MRENSMPLKSFDSIQILEKHATHEFKKNKEECFEGSAGHVFKLVYGHKGPKLRATKDTRFIKLILCVLRGSLCPMLRTFVTLNLNVLHDSIIK